MAFPTSPSNNQVHKETGQQRAFVYDSALGTWDQVRENISPDAGSLTGTINANVGHSQKPGQAVKRSFFGADIAQVDSGVISTNQFVTTGMEIEHTTALSSADSYLIYEFFSSHFYVQSGAEGHQWTCTMRTVSNTTYTVGESVMRGSTPAYWHTSGSSANHFQNYIRVFCGIDPRGAPIAGRPGRLMSMPDTKSSWAPGDKLYFLLFGKRDNGSAVFCKANGSWNLSVTEVTK